MTSTVRAGGLAAVAIVVALAGCGSSPGSTDAAVDGTIDADASPASDGNDGRTTGDADAADAKTDGASDVAEAGDGSSNDGSANDVAGNDGAGNDGSTNDGGDVADRPISADATDAADTRPAGDASDAGDARRPPDGPLDARYVFKLPLLGEQMVGDPQRRRLYVSIGGASPQYPNTLLVVDANTGDVAGTPYVGSNPRSLALSDDSSVLWIGVDGALAIRRMTLTANPPDIGPLATVAQAIGAGQTVGAMVGLPGAPLSVVLSTPDGRKTVVLDDGVARPTSASTLGRTASSLAAGAPGYVYGYDGQDTGFGFLTMAVSASGITDLSTTANLIHGFGTPIVFQSGHVYASTGEIVDVSMPTHPVTGGSLPGVGSIALGPPNRLFVLAGDMPDAGTTRPTQILVIDTTMLKVITTIPFPPDLFGTFNDYGGVTSFVYVGPDTLAVLVRLTNMNTSVQTGTLVVIRDPLIGAVN